MEHIAIENLRQALTRAFVTTDAAVEETRAALAKLDTPEAKETYTPAHRAQKKADILAKAKAAGASQRAEVMALAARLEVTKGAWSTETLMKRARLVPASERIEADLLEELKRLRISADLRDATGAELVEAAGEAREGGNLAMLAMLKKESDRRVYESDAERAQVKVAIGKAIAEVEPAGQKQAAALIADAASTLESVEDGITELLTGTEPARARARRIVGGAAT